MADATEATIVNVDGEPTALYRLYDANGTLLYIGVTGNIAARFAQHAQDKSWWPDVTRKTVVLYGSRPLALAAEDTAIRLEMPAHNVRQASSRLLRNIRRASRRSEGEREASLEQVRATAALAAAERDTYRKAMDRLREAVRAADLAFKAPTPAHGEASISDLIRFDGVEILRRDT